MAPNRAASCAVASNDSPEDAWDLRTKTAKFGQTDRIRGGIVS